MPGINLYSGNRLEILADGLARVAGMPLSSPLEAEIIVVQSRGMERWLSLHLAKRLGVWANARYPFPNSFIRDMFAGILPGTAGADAYEKSVLTWRIMRLLPDCIGGKGFESLARYISGGREQLKLYQLSSRIADTFDQYLTYRPEMMLEWELSPAKSPKTSEDGWQAGLWRLLTRETHGGHKASLLRDFAARTREMPLLIDVKLPERISVFGIPALPRFHLEVLNTLAQYTEVNFFLLNPSKEYWGDIKSEYEIQRSLRLPPADGLDAQDLYLEKGNSLLASTGKMGRDLLWIIMDMNPTMNPIEDFDDPGEDSLLHAIQSDILHMRDRGSSGDDRAGKNFSAGELRADRSIGIHSCHSPMREVEALHDYLLDLFNSETGPGARDILVMTPDIETYAPFIQAVFDSPGDEARRIPYAIADRRLRSGRDLIETFLSVLDLAGSRFGAGSVLGILECPDVLRRFDLLPGDMDALRRWVGETGIRWGVDAAGKARFDVPRTHGNTWRAGIERMLLGYALPGGGEALFDGILPYDNIEGSDTRVLGNFVSFFETLSEAVGGIEDPPAGRTLTAWAETLLLLAENLFLPDAQTRDDMQTLREELKKFGELQRQSSCDTALGLDVVKTLLKDAFNREQEGRNFFTGGVTFCAMMPMRSIPFRVICLLGMNDTAFPRNPASAGFDLMAAHPRRGDRSKRDEDRYIFLETIISARERLYISYVGQSMRDNSAIPPSVLVSELLDYISQGFDPATDSNEIIDSLITRHPLQAFSPRYFGGGDRLFSYSPESCRAARALSGPAMESGPFVNEPLPPSAPAEIVPLNDFIRFFENPARTLLSARLGMRLERDMEITGEREPIVLDALEQYALTSELCSWLLDGKDSESLFRIHRAGGRLPHGAPGEAAFRTILPGVERFVGDIRSITGGADSVSLDIDIKLDGLRIGGTVDSVYPGGVITWRYAEAKARDRLRAWIGHLALNAAGGAHPRRSILLCRNYIVTMEPVENAPFVLESLARIFLRGNNELLPFFPGTSLAWAESMRADGDPVKARRCAQSAWTGSDYTRGDGTDPYFNLCFGRLDGERLFNETFYGLALEIFRPMLDCRKDKKR